MLNDSNNDGDVGVSFCEIDVLGGYELPTVSFFALLWNSPQWRFLLCCGLAFGGGAIVFLSLSLCCCCCFVTTVVIGSRCRCQWRVASMMVPGSPTMKLRCLLCLSGPADAFWRPDNSIVIVVARRTAFSPMTYIHVARSTHHPGKRCRW